MQIKSRYYYISLNISILLSLITFIKLTELQETRNSKTPCCFRGSNICECKKLWINEKFYKHCGEFIHKTQFMRLMHQLYIEDKEEIINNNNKQEDLYTLIAFAKNKLSHYDRVNFTWVSLLYINIPIKCIEKLSSCNIQPVVNLTLGDCPTSTDIYLSQVDIYLIQQKVNITMQDLRGGTDKQFYRKIGYHFISYKILYNTDYFIHPPIRGNRYYVLRCLKHETVLKNIADIITNPEEKLAIETYLFISNNFYNISKHLSEKYPLLYITDYMIKKEYENCDIKYEVEFEHYKGSLHYEFEQCSNVQWLSELKNITNTTEFIDNIHYKIKLWTRELILEYSVLEIIITKHLRQNETIHSVKKEIILSEKFAKAYWYTLYKTSRIAAKLQVFYELLEKIENPSRT
ncbi:unnamed protein product [Trichobilharzia szidati]|nr:unnamed protein product [Trichobilharzia szidati]